LFSQLGAFEWHVVNFETKSVQCAFIEVRPNFNTGQDKALSKNRGGWFVGNRLID
jgi:hypothetical protein